MTTNMAQFDQNLVKGDGDAEFNKCLYAGIGAQIFLKTEEIDRFIRPLVSGLEFKISEGSKQDTVRLWVRAAEWEQAEQQEQAATDKKRLHEFLKLTPIFLIAGPIVSAIIGGLAVWYRFSGQLANGLGTETLASTFWTFGLGSLAVIVGCWIYIFIRKGRTD